MYVYIFQQKYEQDINNAPKKEDFSNILHLFRKNARFTRMPAVPMTYPG